MSCWARGKKRLEEGLLQTDQQAIALSYHITKTPEEENFLLSEENIHEYMYLHDYNILDVHLLLLNLLKVYSRN